MTITDPNGPAPTSSRSEKDGLTKAAFDAPAGAGTIDGFAHPGFAWLDDAACADLDTDDFFFGTGGRLTPAAKEACLTKCEVWRECLIYAYIGNPWAGPLAGGHFATISPGQRKSISLTAALAHVETLREKATTRRP